MKEQANVFQQLREKHKFGIAGCLRADIVDLLVDNLDSYDRGDLQYSQKLIGIKPHLDKVELQFESGHEDVVDLLIGADGINSSVANILNIDDEIRPIYSGANIFYGKIPSDHEYLRDHPIFDEGSVVNGPGTGELIFFHVGAGEKKTFIWVRPN